MDHKAIDSSAPGDRIKPSGEIQSETGSDEENNEQIIFDMMDLPPSDIRLPPCLCKEAVSDIKSSAERTNPTTEVPTEHKREQ